MPEQEVKRMDLKKFREGGYLQEANRRFFHPLGLALEVIIDDEDDSVKLGGVWDYRDDPEGMIFGASVITNPEFAENAEKISKEWDAKVGERRKIMGSAIQPIP